ncbi:MAG TPA: glycerol-3-phosphate responsive antiterminator [Ktedonobacteraceae bacterium]|nr:glycerol-3-phosphate responsive antiterminator [Ktedonobacteraceae bacterium]
MQKSAIRLLSRTKLIPIVENRAQFAQVLKASGTKSSILRHCDLFELEPLLKQAHSQGRVVYVYIDHISGVNADGAGIHFLADQLHISGIISHNQKLLASAKSIGMDTALRIFAADSTGLESALEAVDAHVIDLLDVSPALAIPYIAPPLTTQQPLPFIGSGLISTSEQIQAILQAGASAVAMNHSDFLTSA